MKEKDKKLLKQVLHLSSIGFSLVLAIVMGLVIGIVIDRKFETGPWFTLIFLALGIIAGFRNMYYIFKKYGIDYDESNNEEGDDQED